jgi:hypothetical protein
MCVLIFLYNFIANASHSKKNAVIYIINVHTSSSKAADILLRFGRNLNFLNRFSKNTQNIKFHESRPLEVDCSMHTDGRTEGRADRQTDRYDLAKSRF